MKFNNLDYVEIAIFSHIEKSLTVRWGIIIWKIPGGFGPERE